MTGEIRDEEMLSAYLDGECSAEERAWVEDQIATSAAARAVLDEVRSAREAVRALPMRDAPAGFWARVHADVSAIDDRDPGSGDAPPPASPADLAARRGARPGRVAAAVAATVAAAAVAVAVAVLVPRPQTVDPPVATFTDAHGVRASLQDDAVSSLAPVVVPEGFRR